MQKLKKTISQIEKIDFSLAAKTQKRLDNLTKPQGSLGRLEELAKQIVEITRNEKPTIKKKVIFTMVGDHGVTEEGVSAYPKEVTPQMVYNFIRGGAGINVLARHVGARVVIIDMGVAEKLKIENSKINPSTHPGLKAGVCSGLILSGAFDLAINGEVWRRECIKNFKDKKINFGTQNMTKGPAMTRDEAVKSIEAGIEVFEEEWSNGIDIIGTGDMGIGNTTPSSAIASLITGKPVEDMTGRGTGIDDAALSNKVKIIKKALSVNKPDANDGIDVLSKVGGFEIGGLAGVILAASSRRVPIVIDGFISGAAALVAYRLEPKVKDYMIAAHCSVEKGHKAVLAYMGLVPLLDFNLRLGEGTGAALAMSVIEAGVKILNEMATFQDAGVSEQIDK